MGCLQWNERANIVVAVARKGTEQGNSFQTVEVVRGWLICQLRFSSPTPVIRLGSVQSEGSVVTRWFCANCRNLLALL